MIDPFSTATLVVITVLGSLAYDIGMNTLQDYYHVFYQDAFWEQAGQNPALENRLIAEEREIDRMFFEVNRDQPRTFKQ